MKINDEFMESYIFIIEQMLTSDLETIFILSN